MNDDEHLEKLLTEANTQPPEEREAFLRRRCGDDGDLFKAALEMLASDPKTTSFVQKEAGNKERKPRYESDSSLMNGTIVGGRYTLAERIGEGGMGEVWVARQSTPVKRKVAVKLIKKGMDSRSVLMRFEQERQALALMDHPNIAKVLDGGISDGGQPFFVMELVAGQPLLKFCDQAGLSIPERLELFVPVCQAVQHAHQKGIVHRDLKPANILVTLVDGRPTPKVIDFGVAKAVSGKLTDETLSTQFGAVVGTLEYMAPEQAGHSAADVDTRADVYSLGVILYELLTGLRPFDSKRLRGAALVEMLRIIREEDPPSLSSRLSTDASLPSVASVRGTEPKRLVTLLKGELDWIVRRCLEKDRNRRYETVNSLARDVQRFLADEPVEARPVSSGYRLRKFLRRHRLPVIGAALLTASLVVGVVGTTWQAYRATAAEAEAKKNAADAQRNEQIAIQQRALVEEEQRRTLEQKELAVRSEKTAVAEREKATKEREIAVAVRKFLQDDLLNQGNPFQRAKASMEERRDDGDAPQATRAQTRPETPNEAKVDRPNPTIRELLDRAAGRLAGRDLAKNFRSSPQVYTELLATVADAYQSLGEHDKAVELSRTALAHTLRLEPPDDLAIVDCRCRVVSTTYRAHKLPEFVSEVASLFARIERDMAAKEPGRFDAGLRQLDRLIKTAEIQFLELPSFPSMEFKTLEVAPLALRFLQIQVSIDSIHKAVVSRFGRNDHRACLLRCVAALPQEVAGNRKKAIAEFEDALAGLETSGASNNVLTMLPRINLARLYSQADDDVRATEHAERILEQTSAHFAPDHPHIASAQMLLGGCRFELDRIPEAIELFEKAFKLRKALLTIDHPQTRESLDSLAHAYRKGGRPKEAVRLLEQLRDEQRKRLAQDDPALLSTLHDLAQTLQEVGGLDEAVALFEQVRERRLKKLGLDHDDTVTTIFNLALAYKAKGRVKEAVQLLEQVRELDLKKYGPNHDKTLKTLSNLASAYRADKRMTDSVRLYEQVRDSRVKTLPPDHADVLAALYRLALAYQEGGRLDDAISLLERVRDVEAKKYPPEHHEFVTTLYSLGKAYRVAKKPELALTSFERAAAGLEKSGFKHSSARTILHDYTGALETNRRYDKAEPWRRHCLEVVKKKFGPQSAAYASELPGLGKNLLQQKRLDEAESVYRECLAIRQKVAPDEWQTYSTRALVGGALLARKKYAAAEEQLLEGYRGMKERESKMKADEKVRNLGSVVDRLVELYDATKRPDEAKKWRGERPKAPGDQGKEPAAKSESKK